MARKKEVDTNENTVELGIGEFFSDYSVPRRPSAGAVFNFVEEQIREFAGLWDDGMIPVSKNELTRQTGVTRQTASSALNKLVDEGILRRSEDPDGPHGVYRYAIIKSTITLQVPPAGSEPEVAEEFEQETPWDEDGHEIPIESV